ncbi:glycosyltransferase family 4 protein [Caballeronia sp. LZ032]|uniref:glycosyltransferase family 4 protein n=1 Tax=Caballeronia sp. LZ032 TaxID=3038565 RepID=UPI0028630D47|nr:glycosyltransferase family 4 protein [Caballeronia sp. LZ032]MDR5883634.1 glycosyltransferase family 4 protein [Caballeronia sp. LZ032]
MSMFVKPLHSWFSEPWLVLSRQLTVRTLERQVRIRARQTPYQPNSASMLYVAASSLPYHTTGYTTRTHEVICALQSAGGNVHVLTRPGYPWDRKDRQRDAHGDETITDNVRYQHAVAPYNNRPVLQYALQAAAVVADIARRRRVAVIHAASNHVNALPALLAARQLGIPFQYEMRGLWELTRISRMPQYEASQAFRQGLQLEGLVARQADRLFVISQQLGDYARDHFGVDANRVSLLPNCVDPDRFVPADPQNVEAGTIGYAGSLIGYEGLDTLVDAVDTLAREGHPVSVTVIGDGEARPQLEDQVRRLGLTDRIRFVGKMRPEAARAMLSRCALVCIPRKPFKVCQIVPPIKLVEALAMGKPVIVPDLPVFRDEMGDCPPGWFFKSGDAGDLARKVKSALSDVEELGRMGRRAREHAVTQRRWRDFVVEALPVQGEV